MPCNVWNLHHSFRGVGSFPNAVDTILDRFGRLALLLDTYLLVVRCLCS